MLPSGAAVETFAEEIGARIRAAREAAGLSQADVARRLGVSRASVSLWEAGERMPGLDTVYALGAVLGRSPDFFFPASEDEPSTREAAPLTLRAVVSNLSGKKLGSEIDRVVANAKRIPAPERAYRPRSRDPIAAAQELLSAMRATAPPIDAERAAELCGARVVRHRFSSDALSGFLVALEDGAMIAVNHSHHPVRQRFTLAHELGHLVMGHFADYHLDLASSVDSGEPPGYDWRHERLANTFAANLLMPAGLVRADYLSDNFTPERLATRYRVSREAMGIRLTTLGLV